MSIVRNADGSRKVIGSTTMSTIGGAQSGLLIAILLTEVFGLKLSPEATQGLACLLALAGMLLGGWLSPSKEAEARQVIEDYKLEQALEATSNAPAVKQGKVEVGDTVAVSPESMTVSMGTEDAQGTLF